MGSETSARRSKRRFSLKWTYVLIGLLVVVLIGGGVLGYMQYSKLKDENNRLSNPQEAAKSETAKIKSEVAMLIDVPTDEEPTIATVTDSSKLSSQAFFAKAQNGDKVIMYQKAKKAILYRPSTNKIIEVAPINIGDTSQTNKTSDKTATDQATTQNAGTTNPTDAAGTTSQ